MRIKTNFGIIAFRLWCRQQDDPGSTPKPRLGEADQINSNSLLLVSLIDGQIRQIATKLEVCHRTCNADQFLAVPCSAKQVRVIEHCLDALRVIDGPSLREIAAPGVNIYSTYKQNGFATMSGTSMAAPHVAGALALIYSRNPSITPANTRLALLGAATAQSPVAPTADSKGRLRGGFSGDPDSSADTAS